jgi:hypothetical protein
MKPSNIQCFLKLFSLKKFGSGPKAGEGICISKMTYCGIGKGKVADPTDSDPSTVTEK